MKMILTDTHRQRILAEADERYITILRRNLEDEYRTLGLLSDKDKAAHIESLGLPRALQGATVSLKNTPVHAGPFAQNITLVAENGQKRTQIGARTIVLVVGLFGLLFVCGLLRFRPKTTPSPTEASTLETTQSCTAIDHYGVDAVAKQPHTVEVKSAMNGEQIFCVVNIAAHNGQLGVYPDLVALEHEVGWVQHTYIRPILAIAPDLADRLLVHDSIVLQSGPHTQHYQVTTITTIGKKDVPNFFAQTDNPELVLFTLDKSAERVTLINAAYQPQLAHPKSYHHDEVVSVGNATLSISQTHVVAKENAYEVTVSGVVDAPITVGLQGAKNGIYYQALSDTNDMTGVFSQTYKTAQLDPISVLRVETSGSTLPAYVNVPTAPPVLDATILSATWESMTQNVLLTIRMVSTGATVTEQTINFIGGDARPTDQTFPVFVDRSVDIVYRFRPFGREVQVQLNGQSWATLSNLPTVQP